MPDMPSQPTTSQISPLQPGKGASKNRRNKKKSHKLHLEKRKEDHEENPPTICMTCPTMIAKHVRPSKKIKSEYNIKDIPIASSGFITKPDVGGEVCNLADLLGPHGFKLVKNNGKYAPFRTLLHHQLMPLL